MPAVLCSVLVPVATKFGLGRSRVSTDDNGRPHKRFQIHWHWPGPVDNGVLVRKSLFFIMTCPGDGHGCPKVASCGSVGHLRHDGRTERIGRDPDHWLLLPCREAVGPI